MSRQVDARARLQYLGANFCICVRPQIEIKSVRFNYTLEWKGIAVDAVVVVVNVIELA